MLKTGPDPEQRLNIYLIKEISLKIGANGLIWRQNVFINKCYIAANFTAQQSSTGSTINGSSSSLLPEAYQKQLVRMLISVLIEPN